MADALAVNDWQSYIQSDTDRPEWQLVWLHRSESGEFFISKDCSKYAVKGEGPTFGKAVENAFFAAGLLPGLLSSEQEAVVDGREIYICSKEPGWASHEWDYTVI
jgi:hypothetical protein